MKTQHNFKFKITNWPTEKLSYQSKADNDIHTHSTTIITIITQQQYNNDKTMKSI